MTISLHTGSVSNRDTFDFPARLIIEAGLDRARSYFAIVTALDGKGQFKRSATAHVEASPSTRGIDLRAAHANPCGRSILLADESGSAPIACKGHLDRQARARVQFGDLHGQILGWVRRWRTWAG